MTTNSAQREGLRERLACGCGACRDELADAVPELLEQLTVLGAVVRHAHALAHDGQQNEAEGLLAAARYGDPTDGLRQVFGPVRGSGE